MNKEFEKHLTKVINKYKKILFLEDRRIELKFGTDKETSFMEVSFTYPYLDTIIYYSQNAINDWKAKINIESHIVHELVHIITDPLYSKACDRYIGKNEIEDERELLTDKIANIITLNRYKK